MDKRVGGIYKTRDQFEERVQRNGVTKLIMLFAWSLTMLIAGVTL